MGWARFLEINNITKSYKDCSLNALYNYKPVAVDFIKNKTSMVLKGECGTGKTFFMLSTIHALLEHAKLPLWYVFFVKAKTLSDRIDQEYRQYGTTKTVIDQCLEAPYLFIDDFGVQARTERMERDFYEICDVRLADQRPTMFSTNLSEENLKSVFGARIYSRLKQCHRLDFNGKDLRGMNE